MKNRFWFLAYCLILGLSFLDLPSAKGQIVWELPLYFSDAVGNRDTVVIGVAEDATTGTDTLLGEIEINDQLWDTTFEVRIIHGDSPGGGEDLKLNPQYKKMYLKGEGGFGTTSFGVISYRIVVRANFLPITMSYDQNLIGYPSTVNLFQDRTEYPGLLKNWTLQPFPPNDPASPTFRCLMHHDSIVEDFRYFFWTDSLLGHGHGKFGTTIYLDNGDTIYTPGFEIHCFPSWSEDYYCDRIVGIHDVYLHSENLFIQNPVSDYLRLRLDNQLTKEKEWVIYSTSGNIRLHGDFYDSDEINVSSLPYGLYIFITENESGQMVVSRFIKI